MHAFPFHEPRDPGATDDDVHGFEEGGFWINEATRRLFECQDAATGAADWLDVTALIAPDAAVVDDRLVVFDGITGRLSKQGAKTGTEVATHLDSTANPHGVTAAQAGAYTTAQVDALVDPTLKAPEAFAPSGTYPVTYDGGAVSKGDSFRITAAGTMGAVTVNVEDLLIALVDTPAQVDASWMVVESNRDQATETVKGVAELATQAETDAGTNDTNIVTPLKLANSAVPAHVHTHASTTGQTADDHHNQSHEFAGADHGASTLASVNTKVSDATLDDSGDPRPPIAHALAGADHTSATLAALNLKISDANVDDSGDARPPTAHVHTHASATGQTANDHHNQSHALAGADHAAATLTELNAKVSDATLDDAGDPRTPSAHVHTHASTTGQTADDHHAESHTVASHSDTVATGADLDVMVGGGDANGLHTHAPAQLFIWGFSTNTTAADPGAGRVRANNATPASITALYFSSLDAAGLDFDNFFAMIPAGDTLLAQQTDDASKRLLLTVGTLVDEGGWWTVPVTVDADAGGLFGNNKDTSWLIRLRM